MSLNERRRRKRLGNDPYVGEVQQVMPKKIVFMEEVDYKMEIDDG